jgi:hypothetical protein
MTEHPRVIAVATVAKVSLQAEKGLAQSAQRAYNVLERDVKTMLLLCKG